jgi:hypothetical protein
VILKTSLHELVLKVRIFFMMIREELGSSIGDLSPLTLCQQRKLTASQTPPSTASKPLSYPSK